MPNTLRLTDVHSANGVIATSHEGGMEYNQIDLRFPPGGGNAINVGGHYTLTSGAHRWTTMCTARHGDQFSFEVM